MKKEADIIKKLCKLGDKHSPGSPGIFFKALAIEPRENGVVFL